MRAVIQRVRWARVVVEGETVGEIEQGMVVLLGVEDGDTRDDAIYLAGKTIGLRIFEDEQGKMNRSVLDVQGQALVVSQFTLLGDCRKGRRPSFVNAAGPELGEALYLDYCQQLRDQGLPVETGKFRADMDVELVNQGPVTLLLDSRKRF